VSSSNIILIQLLISYRAFSLWKEPLVVPVYFSAFSALILVLQVLWRTEFIQKLVCRIRRSDVDPTVKLDQDNVPTPPEDVGFFVELKHRIKQHGGVFPFSIKITRVLCCVVLLAISTVAFIQDEEVSDDDTRSFKGGFGKPPRGRKHRHSRERLREYFRHEEWIEVAMCVFYVRQQSAFWYMQSIVHWYHPLYDLLLDVCVASCVPVSHHGPPDAGQSDDTPLDPSVCNVLYIWVSGSVASCHIHIVPCGCSWWMAYLVSHHSHRCRVGFTSSHHTEGVRSYRSFGMLMSLASLSFCSLPYYRM
jgi:hypothetical protein